MLRKLTKENEGFDRRESSGAGGGTGGGFTIIEVLIVLAIAGLIMLIVFLAVPALQRNSRNNARNNDAAKIAAAITECLSNRNGQTGSCDSDAEIEQGTTTQLTTVTLGAGLPAAGDTVTARFQFDQGCSAAGDAVAAGNG